MESPSPLPSKISMAMARKLHHEPRVLVAAQPTRGLDVGATEYVRNKLLGQRSRGASILLISTELEEILSLSDRVLVLYEGAIMGEFSGDDVDLERPRGSNGAAQPDRTRKSATLGSKQSKKFSGFPHWKQGEQLCPTANSTASSSEAATTD